MTTSTLHLNNPVPSNGAVVPSLGGRHTVTVTLAGVGAISCVVQAWGSEQGTDSRKIGAPVTVSGTTTVSQTLTFDADCKQFWLELVSLSPACKFNATVENDGTISLSGPAVYADGLSRVNSLALDLPKWRKALVNAAMGVKRARIALVGDSTVAAVGNNGDSTARAGDFNRSIGRYMADFLPSRLGLEVRRDSVWGTQNLTKAQVRPGGYDPRVTQTAGVDEDAINTVGGRAIKFVSPADEVTFTPGASTASTFILHTVGAQASWGAIDVYVDDVLITTISAASGTGHTVTTIATAGNVLRLVNKTQGNNQFDLIGIEAFQASARQVQILQMGWAGSKIASHANSSASYRHLPVLATIAPDLVIIKCTTNDSLDTDTPAKRAQYLADLTTVVNSAKTYADVIFADCFPSQYSDDDPSILDFYRQCAVGLGLPIIDLRSMFGTTSTAALATGLAVGNVHPGEIGYATIGKMYSERISPWW